MATKNIGDWSVEELEARIDDEGLDYVFTYYADSRTWEGTPIEKEAAAFRKARTALVRKLEKLGVYTNEI